MAASKDGSKQQQVSMTVAGKVASLVAGVASRSLLSQSQQVLPAASAAISCWLKNSPSISSSSLYHTSTSAWQATAPTTAGGAVATAYEPRFGTEDNPIQVPALLNERIIGVTDPEDDTLVIWGVIRDGEPPKQLVAGGEFFVLKKVERVEKVGDKLGIPLVPTIDH
eukprot:gene6909-7125_t